MTAPSTGIVLRGRARESAAISDRLDALADGRGGALLFSGVAGLGKSVLLNAATGLAEERGFEVVRASGWVNESRLGFAGLHRMLLPDMRRVGRLPAAQAEALQRALATGECQAAEQFALSLAVLALWRDRAASAPLVVCIDDAQWLDRPSLDVLAFVAHRIAGERIAMIIATRTSTAVDLIPGVASIRLSELDDTASREVLSDVVPSGLAGDVAGVLTAIAGGNPKALVELADSLTAEQRRGNAAPPLGLPAESRLRRECQAMLAELPDDAQSLMLLLAADSDLDVGGLVRAAAAAGIDVAALEPAERGDIVRIKGSQIRFAQPFLSAVVYDDATLARRREAHRLLAATIEADRAPLRHRLHRAAFADGPDPELAAELESAAAGAGRAAASLALEKAAELTGEPAMAARYLIAAARHAWEGGEPHRARMLLRGVRTAKVPAHFSAQAELLLGEIELRAGGTNHARQTLLTAAGELEPDREMAVSAMMRAGEATLHSGEYADYPNLARKALALRREEESSGTDLKFEQFIGMTAIFKGRFDEAVRPLRRVITLSLELDDPPSLFQGSIAATLLGDELEAIRLAIRAAAVARATGDASIVPQALELAATAEFALGRYDAGTVTLMEALPLARTTGQASLAASLAAALALNAAVTGDRATCLSRIREARTYTGSHRAVRPEAVIEYALGMLDFLTRPADALSRLRALRSGAGRGQVVIAAAATPNVVEAAVRSGDRDAGLAAFAVFEPWARIMAQPIWLAHAERCSALLAEDEAEIDRHFELALGHHVDSGSDFERARTELLYGQSLRRRRHPTAAREHLRAAAVAFHHLDAPTWTELAEGELRASGEPGTSGQPNAAELLTPQQLQIARLAVSGATNREVAAQMSISTRTVDHHMRNILARLDIRSRVELAKLLGDGGGSAALDRC